ncbi:MAG: hypothetical protein H7257_06420 [Taibaiella sp.]|nr:hypothetical protein [Taibaiella sp.]
MNRHTFYGIFLLCVCCLFGVSPSLYGQVKDTSDKMTIHILNNRVLTFTKTDSGDFFRFVGDVIMQQGTDTLYCDSLIQNKTTNILEAFSNVRIAQDGGTQGLCDYLKYTSSQKLALMQGNVSLTDGKNQMWCNELTYDLGTKTGVYNNGGTLHADSTTVTSNSGIYNVKTKEARFTGNVTVKDPAYTTTSKDMGYNTETKLTRFFAPSVVVGDSGKTRLQTSSGTYDSHNSIAYFETPSKIWYDGQYIEGDTLYYNKLTGNGYGNGHVIAWDTAHGSTLYCGHAAYNQRKREMWATVKPVLKQIKGTDTLYIRADTFHSAPMAKILPPKAGTVKDADTGVVKRKEGSYKLPAAADSSTLTAAQVTPVALLPVAVPDTLPKTGSRKKKKGAVTAAVNAPSPLADTAWADSTAPLYFCGYHHVLIFSDSLQGVCDSICYTQSDSTIRMIYNPIAWSRKSQVTGDTICLQLDSNRLRSIYVPNNAFIVSLAGPDKAGLYDQVQGRTLKGYLKNNTITSMLVFPGSEAIYYSKDERGAYIGVSQSKSDRMKVTFEDQAIKKINFERDVHQTLTPLDKADIPNTRLSRFKWLDDKRPRSKEELFE